MDNETLENLRTVKLFKGCSDSFLDHVARNIRISRINAGIDIINFGDYTKDVYINFEGLLEVTYLLQEGRKVTFDLITPCRFFGEISSIDERARSATISTLTSVKLGTIKNGFFIDYMLNDKDFLRALLNKSSSTIRNNNQQIIHLASADSKKKVLIQLLRLARGNITSTNSLKVVERVSHDTVASFVGLSRETVTRMIGVLKKDGMIVGSRKGNITLDIDKISEFIQLSEDELFNWVEG